MEDEQPPISDRVLRAAATLSRILIHKYRRCDLSQYGLSSTELNDALVLLYMSAVQTDNTAASHARAFGTSAAETEISTLLKESVHWITRSAKLEQLWELDLRGNALLSVPDALSRFDRVERILLDNCQLKRINSNSDSPFVSLTPNFAVRHLSLSHNELGSSEDDTVAAAAVPSFLLEQFPQLRVLDLSHNSLQDVCISFDLMDLFHNEFKVRRLMRIESDSMRADTSALFTNREYLAELIKQTVRFAPLIRLDMSNNKLKDFPWRDIAESCPQLASLHLAHNSLTYIDEAIKYLKELRHFGLEGNPFPNIDVQNAQQRYFSDALTPEELRRASSLYKMFMSDNRFFSMPNMSLVELCMRFVTKDIVERGEDIDAQKSLPFAGEQEEGDVTMRDNESIISKLIFKHDDRRNDDNSIQQVTPWRMLLDVLPEPLRKSILSAVLSARLLNKHQQYSKLFPPNRCSHCGSLFVDMHCRVVTIGKAVKCQDVTCPVIRSVCSFDCAKACNPVLVGAWERYIKAKGTKYS